MDNNGKEVNFSYLDSQDLTQTVKNFIIESIQKQIIFCIKTNICFCIGTGENSPFLQSINNKYGFFKKIIALTHPRYIMQFKSKTKQEYINKYVDAFNKII